VAAATRHHHRPSSSFYQAEGHVAQALLVLSGLSGLFLPFLEVIKAKSDSKTHAKIPSTRMVTRRQ
jgi:hypothetical protein